MKRLSLPLNRNRSTAPDFFHPPSALCAGFVPYAGEGFAVLIPSKWNPSKEQDFPGTVLRCVCLQA